jgi:hypothetical protein
MFCMPKISFEKPEERLPESYGPASKRRTVPAFAWIRRAATAHPADPAPAIMKSNSVSVIFIPPLL